MRSERHGNRSRGRGRSSRGDLHHPRADDTARGVPGENPDFGGQVRGCGHAESGEARKFKGHNHCISYMESAMTDCVEDDTHRRQNIKYQPRNMHNTTPLHMSRDNQEMVAGLLRSMRDDEGVEGVPCTEEMEKEDPASKTTLSKSATADGGRGRATGLKASPELGGLRGIVGAKPKVSMAFVSQQHAHMNCVAAEAERIAAQEKEAALAAVEARTLREQLHSALVGSGFSDEWASKAVSKSLAQLPEGNLPALRATALHWLCLRVPMEDMPDSLLQGSASWHAGAGGWDRREGQGARNRVEEEGQAVRLVRLVLVRRLCLLLGVAPAEAVAALKQAEFDEQQALYSLMYSLQPQEHLEDEKAEKDHEGSDEAHHAWMEERNQEVLALRAIFDAAFEAESPHLWRVEVDLAGGDGSGGAREAVLAALGPCALEIHIPPQNRYPLEAPLPLLRNAALHPRSRRAINGALAAHAHTLRGSGPMVYTLVLWLQCNLPTVAAHFMELDDVEDDDEEGEEEGQLAEAVAAPEESFLLGGALGRTYERLEARERAANHEAELKAQRIDLLRRIVAGQHVATPPARTANTQKQLRHKQKDATSSSGADVQVASCIDQAVAAPGPPLSVEAATEDGGRRAAWEERRATKVKEAIHHAAIASNRPHAPSGELPKSKLTGTAGAGSCQGESTTLSGHPAPPKPGSGKSGWLAKHLNKQADTTRPQSFPSSANAPAPALAVGDEGINAEARPGHCSSAVDKVARLDKATAEAKLQRESQRLLRAHRQRQSNSAYLQMQKTRETLPAYALRDDIVAAVSSHQVTVISGATGCGKTTQVPQLLLDSALELGCGAGTRIICTQPRRISAVSVAERVAAERAGRVGDEIGYSIRMEGKSSAATRVLFCTTGVLLRRLQSDPLLQGVSHVIVDEVHERDLNSDFLLIVLRDMLPKRPDFRVVAMSATVNADLFANYFCQVTSVCPVVEIPGRTFPVQEYRLEDAIEATGYVCEPGSIYAKGGGGSTASGRFGRGGGKGGGQGRGHQLKGSFGGGSRGSKMQSLIADSLDKEAEVDPAMAAQYPGYSDSTLRCLQTVDEQVINFELLEALIRHISTEYNDGAILVFLPGMAEIRTLYDMLASEMTRDEGFLLIPLHSTLSSEEQLLTFSTPPPGVRKVVLATNIAETSITIDDVVFVIDSGKVKEMQYDPRTRMASLETGWVSRASARQRRGRAGRCTEGYCFHLFSSTQEAALADFTQAEIMRVPLEQLCLQIKALRLGDVAAFLGRAIEPPSEAAIRRAGEALRELAAVDDSGELTPLGSHMAELPVDARVGKMILYAAVFGCLDPVLTIAAGMSVRSPFLAPMSQRDAADAARRALAAPVSPSDITPFSDHCVLLRAYNGWQAAKARGRGADRAYAGRYFLSPTTLKSMTDLKRQFAELLAEIGFVSGKVRMRDMERSKIGDGVLQATGKNANAHAGCMPLVRAVVCAGLYPNIACIQARAGLLTSAADAEFAQSAGQHQVINTRIDGQVAIHPSSINFNCPHFHHNFLLYHEKVLTTKIYLRETTVVGGYPLLLFAGKVEVRHDRGTICCDDWIEFKAPLRVAVLFKELRSELDKILLEKIESPATEAIGRGKDDIVRVTQAIIKLLVAEDYTGEDISA